MSNLLPPEKLDLTAGSNIGNNWKIFQKAWTNYKVAAGLDKKSKQVRLATFLHIIGPAANEKYETFTYAEDED